MKKVFMILLLALAGCTTTSTFNSQVQVGMTREALLKAVGNPTKREVQGDLEMLTFYTHSPISYRLAALSTLCAERQPQTQAGESDGGYCGSGPR